MARCSIAKLPTTPIEQLIAVFRSYLYLPDPGPLYVLVGAVAANMIEGTPVWLMFVGPPSCGKSELLNSTLKLSHIVEAADISGDAAFLSGTPGKDRSKDATGGLLRQIGPRGGLILNDFTSVLAKSQERISSIMAIFREAYGGRWTRHIGSEGGRALTWTGKLAVFAGVTGKIDQQHQMAAEMGERWIYYRFAERDSFPDVMLALSNERNGWRGDLAGAVVKFFSDLDLSFNSPAPRRDFRQCEKIRIHELATLAVRCRSGVARDGYSKEIIGARETELATRLAAILAQLLAGLDAVGVDSATSWRLLAKVAFDSMPRLRRMIIDAVHRKPMTIQELTGAIQCGKSVIRRAVEDLQVQGVLLRADTIVSLTDWMQAGYRRFLEPSDSLWSE